MCGFKVRVNKIPFVIGYDEQAKIAFVVGDSDIAAEALESRGYRVIRLREVPKILYGWDIYRERRRPIVGGLSIGTGMATGTAGYIVKYYGEPAILTNAHVVTPTPWMEIPNPDPIIQPGIADGGKKPNDVVAKYWTHVKVELEGKSSCPVARIWSGIYNFFAEVLHRRTRLVPLMGVDEKSANKVDVGIAKIENNTEHELYTVLMPDGSVIKPDTVYGLLFAGSEQDNIAIVCKMRNIVDALPGLDIGTAIGDVKIGDKVAKAGRTTGFTVGTVIAANATLKVYYGAGFAVFKDVIVVRGDNEIMSKPGDSGSLVFSVPK